MCGIVGYIGDKSAQQMLTTGLKRLEYRGYDSAGIVTLNKKGVPTLLRTKGKVSELDQRVAAHQKNDTVGIGHTRWATHGEPSKRNAHPHEVGDIFLVHNGIIENYQELKSMLTAKDYVFKSDTDTEVLAALIDHVQKTAKSSLLQAVTEALRMSVGAYGIAVINVHMPDEIVIARKGSPLIVGVGKNETYIASDASALIGYTDKVVYLQDGEIGVCRKDGLELFDIDAQPKEAVIETITTNLEAIQKNGFDHFLLKEIHEQPNSLSATLKGRLNQKGEIKLGGIDMTDNELRQIEHIVIVGCGTAYYAGLLGQYLTEQFTKDVTFSVEIASELRYRSFHLPKNTVALIVSQSGETADTLACLQELKRRGVRCLGVVNAVGSTIAREVDGGLYVHVGPEISVASTKAFTSQVSAILLIGLAIAQAKGVSKKQLQEYIDELIMLPDEIQKTLDKHEAEVKKIAQKYKDYTRAIFIGRDTLYPTALEGALKLKEVSYIQAEAHAAGELKHGPIALIDNEVFVVAYIQDNWLYEKSQSNITEIHARGAHSIVITDTDKRLGAETTVRIKTKLKLLTPLVFNIISQLLAYYVATARGNDVDQPRNLAKSVTVE